jgi:O-antigen ligase
MPNGYNVSVSTLLRQIGLTPGRKTLVFFITLVAVTVALEHAYNSFAVIGFVLFSILSARRHHMRFTFALALPMVLYGLMCLSLLWSPSLKISATALGKEAALVFIPLAFMLSRPLTFRSHTAILKSFSLGMCLYGAYLVGRALVRYAATADASVFFYNELASEKLSVYLSCFFSLALFFFLSQKNKTFWGHVATAFMLCLVLLLSKKSIIVTDIIIISLYYLAYSNEPVVRRLAFTGFFWLAGGLFSTFGNLSQQPEKHKLAWKQRHMVSISEAWNQPVFNHNDDFSGMSFRAYRARVLAEMSTEKGFMLTGSGINTSGLKVQQIAQKHNTTHPGWEKIPYSKLNFHNQYMEIYADLGIFGLAVFLVLVIYNLVKALKSGYFIHLAFAVLMISLFLTESFLWRQKGVVFFTLFYCLLNDCTPVKRLKQTK